MKPLLMTLAFTGMRSGELRRMRMCDVDLNKNCVHVVSRPGLETKTRESRTVPLHPILRDLLTPRVRADDGFLFCAEASERYPLGNHWINPKHLNDRFVALVRRLRMPAGRDESGLTIHSLRRFFETHAVNHHVPQRCIDQWLGHASDSSMGAWYYSLRDEDSQRFMQQLPFHRPSLTE